MAKWPTDLDFGEEVIVITRDFVRNADEEEISLANNGEVFDSDSPDLIGVFRIPES